MRKCNTTLLLISLCFILSNAVQQGNLVLLTEAPNAKCLDGTSTGYYYFQGSGNGSNKFLIFMNGGGYCLGNTIEEILESCLQRSKTTLGSSSKWPKSFSNTGIFSSDEAQNPSYHNWNKVFIQYCDGSLFQGSADVNYQGTTLSFRGYDNVVESFNHLIATTNIQSADVVVLSGASAGGLGAFYWNQYLRKVINPHVPVIAAPDSGFFVDIPGSDQSNKYQLMDLITNGNRSIIQPEGCEYLYDDANAYKCTYPENLIDLMPVPVFIYNSLYDSYIIKNQLGVNCMTANQGLVNCSKADQYKVELLHNLTVTQLQKIQQSKPTWGIWAISCLQHVFSDTYKTYNGPNYQVTMDSGLTVSVALKNYIEAYLNGETQNNFYIDTEIYPQNANCNGLSNSSNKFLSQTY